MTLTKSIKQDSYIHQQLHRRNLKDFIGNEKIRVLIRKENVEIRKLLNELTFIN